MSKKGKFLPSMLASLSVLGGGAVSAKNVPELPDVKSESISSYRGIYTEKDFEQNLRYAFNDILIRMSTGSTDFKNLENCYYKYKARLSNGDKIVITSKFSLKENSDLRVHIRSILDQGISLLNQNKKIFLPTSDIMLYMPDDARNLMNKWKKDGTYDLKINSIIDSCMDIVLPDWRLKSVLTTSQFAREDSFSRDMKALLSDIKLRLVYPNEPVISDVPEYAVKLTNGKVINIATPKEIKGTSFRYMIDQILDILEKNSIFLPTLNKEISLSPEIQSLVDSWKRDGTYDSRINDIVNSFTDSFQKNV